MHWLVFKGQVWLFYDPISVMPCTSVCFLAVALGIQLLEKRTRPTPAHDHILHAWGRSEQLCCELCIGSERCSSLGTKPVALRNLSSPWHRSLITLCPEPHSTSLGDSVRHETSFRAPKNSEVLPSFEACFARPSRFCAPPCHVASHRRMLIAVETGKRSSCCALCCNLRRCARWTLEL